MTAPDAFVHPRKLYAALCASSSSDARAHDVLSFLCASSGAEHAFLFLLRDGQLALAASHHAGEPVPELLEELQRVWDRELDVPPDGNRTLDVSELQAAREGGHVLLVRGQSFQPRTLSTYRGASWVPVGIVALQIRDDRELEVIRQAHIDAICNALLDATSTPPAP